MERCWSCQSAAEGSQLMSFRGKKDKSCKHRGRAGPFLVGWRPCFCVFWSPFHVASSLNYDWTEIQTVKMHIWYDIRIPNDTGASLIVKTPNFLLNLPHFKFFIAQSDSQQIRARNLKEKMFFHAFCPLSNAPPLPQPHPGDRMLPICARLWNISAIQYSAGLSQAFSVCRV